MEIILYESTKTVHKRKAGESDRHTTCGVTRTRPLDHFQQVSVEFAATQYNIDKCGRCFEGEGGY